MNDYCDITTELRRVISDLDDVCSMMVRDDDVWRGSFWAENGLRTIVAIRNQLRLFLSRPEDLLDPSESPRLSQLLSHLRDVGVTWVWDDRQLLGALHTTESLLISLTSGVEIREHRDLLGPATPTILVPTEATMADLIRRLGPDPRAWHALGPRKFEELLAEIWSGLGWETILTPPSGDGGFDVRAIRHQDGTCLCYLIEAKSYDPTKPIGIDIVRHLYGVVERECATHGIIATTSRFTRGAIQESHALRYRVSLANFEQVFKWSQKYLSMSGTK